jgi:hypothetical protein
MSNDILKRDKQGGGLLAQILSKQACTRWPIVPHNLRAGVVIESRGKKIKDTDPLISHKKRAQMLRGEKFGPQRFGAGVCQDSCSFSLGDVF